MTVKILVGWLPRAVLLLIGLLLVNVGLSLGLDPAKAVGVHAEGAGVTHLRVAFGGFHVGVGLLGIAAAAFRSMTRTGLIALATILGSVVSFRLYGIHVDGASASNLTTLGREAPPLVLTLVALAANAFGARLGTISPRPGTR
ncbi:MAG: Domain protein of unknown function [Sphingomonas bacterium]|uniref:hypothetical protein n=1 Tax=Sphingomonas bacterium TaxID=1895847 RepID=UPI00262B577C|nr:hypothetical protein [Sphingomonas bacterium]MDB5708770.1 Domain protein of unknown function [Sphingomonas bacterium]